YGAWKCNLAGATVHFAVVNGVETNGLNSMKQLLAQRERVDVRRRWPPHPHVHMARIVHEVAKAGMGLQPATIRQGHSTRRDVVDRCAAISLTLRDLRAWLWDLIAWLLEANEHFRSGRFRRCIGSSVLDVLIRRQLQTSRNHPNGRPEPLVEGGRIILGRGNTIERHGTIIPSGETLVERRVRARAGRICQHGSRLGWGIEQPDLRFQACQSDAIARGP